MRASEGETGGAVVVPAALIVRAWREAGGHLTGVVERVATGEKARFQTAGALVELVERMVPKVTDGRPSEVTP